MQKASKIFTAEEQVFDCEIVKTGEFRAVRRALNYSPDAEPDSPTYEEYQEERLIYRHPDGREGESWTYRGSAE